MTQSYVPNNDLSSNDICYFVIVQKVLAGTNFKVESWPKLSFSIGT